MSARIILLHGPTGPWNSQHLLKADVFHGSSDCIQLSTETKQLTLDSLHYENMSSDDGIVCIPKYIMTIKTLV